MTKIIQHRESYKPQSGFTLIELSMSIIIMGVLLAAIITPYTIWLQKKDLERTNLNVEQMALRVVAYRTETGHYPCPAAIDVARDDPNYGRATDCTAAVTALETCVAAGNVVCRTASARNVTVDTNIVDDTFTPSVRIGAIPFRDLGIPEAFSYDAHGSRILYAVTEEMAADIPRNVAGVGGLGVQFTDNSGGTQSHVSPDNSAEFVVLSHGVDRVGGYGKMGGNTIACNVANFDGENCDYLTANLDSIFYLAETSSAGATSAQQHDDVVRFQMPLNAPYWVRSSVEPSHIYSIHSDQNPSGRIGSDRLFEFYDSEAKATLSNYAEVYEKSKLWVGGNLKVEANPAVPETGQVQAQLLCDREGENCFNPEVIGGSGTACDDTSAELMQGFKEGEKDCRSGVIEVRCPAGQFLKGFENGKKDCALLPCRAATKSLCGTSVDLPDATGGTQTARLYGGDYECYNGVYSCTGGNWTLGSTQGMCGCTASSETYQQNCAANCSVETQTRIKGVTCASRNCNPFDNPVTSCGTCVAACNTCGCPGYAACPEDPPVCNTCDCPGYPACDQPPECPAGCGCAGFPACPPDYDPDDDADCEGSAGDAYGPC